MKKKIYTYYDIEQIHMEAKGDCFAFNRDYKDDLFFLESVNMVEIPVRSLWKMNELISMCNSSNEYKKELDTIRNLIYALEKGETLPPVVLGLKQFNGTYDIKDGVHRLSAMREKGIQEFEAFVKIPLDDPIYQINN